MIGWQVNKHSISRNPNIANCKILYDSPHSVKPQLHCHDFGHDGATTHPDLSSRDASAWVVAAP